MKNRLATTWGLRCTTWGLGLTAALLLALTPVIHAVHLGSCPHHHGAGIQGHTHSHTSNARPDLPNGGGIFFNNADLWSGPCPICLTLSVLGKGLVLSGQILDSLPAVTAIGLPPSRPQPLQLPLFASPIRPRAPPSLPT